MRVDTAALRKLLTGKDKLPPKLIQHYANVNIPGLNEVWDVCILGSLPHRGHRICIQCGCGRSIPAGRWAQHRKACQEKNKRNGETGWAIKNRYGQYFEIGSYCWVRELGINTFLYDRSKAANLSVNLYDCSNIIPVIHTWQGWKEI